jgi:hypothetical protein
MTIILMSGNKPAGITSMRSSKRCFISKREEGKRGAQTFDGVMHITSIYTYICDKYISCILMRTTSVLNIALFHISKQPSNQVTNQTKQTSTQTFTVLDPECSTPGKMSLCLSISRSEEDIPPLEDDWKKLIPSAFLFDKQAFFFFHNMFV